MITLEHPFFKDNNEQLILELYTCNSFKEFEKNIKTFIEEINKKNKLNGRLELDEKDENEIKGDIFEGL